MDVDGLVRMVCLALTMYGYQIASTPPNPPASADEQAKYSKEHKARDVMPLSVKGSVILLRVSESLQGQASPTS